MKKLILSDNFSSCVELGQYFVKQLNKKGKYVEFLGLVGDNNIFLPQPISKVLLKKEKALPKE